MERLGRPFATAAIALLAPLLVAAQQPVDFSGAWTRSSPPLSANSSHRELITQSGRELTVVVEQSGPAGSMGYWSKIDHAYTIDGPVQSKSDADGRIRAVAVFWEGPRLVFIRTTTEGANSTIVREAWSLTDSGTTLVKDRRTTDWKGASDERIVLKRD